eukprot:9199924-Alexandrium_andersonii.AAC.1
MSASLVGSEMCIRDRWPPTGQSRSYCSRPSPRTRRRTTSLGGRLVGSRACLLYTSDAADDM